jgi:hypothetical protein
MDHSKGFGRGILQTINVGVLEALGECGVALGISAGGGHERLARGVNMLGLGFGHVEDSRIVVIGGRVI